jgi:acyl-coenzyme A synthetase/AMP-(fatty) acid ligase
MNILADFLEKAPRFGTRPAIIEGTGRTASFDAIIRDSASLAHAWQRNGLKAGDRALIAMPLGIDLYIGLAALWRLGAVAVFSEPALGLAGLRHAARITWPDAFLTGGWYEALRYLVPELWRVRRVLRVNPASAPPDDLANVSPETPALISFTSGSTGAPKAISRSHGFLAAQNAAVSALIAPRHDRETDLVAFPVFVIANLALGITSVLPNWNLRRHHEAQATDIIAHLRQFDVKRALIPPSICEILAQCDQPVGLDAIFTGGGPVFPDMIERLLKRNGECDITAVYGSTEAEPIAHLHLRDIQPEDWQGMRSGAGLLAGSPVPDVRLMLRDEEIIVSGAHVNKGYLDPAQDASTKLTIEGEIWHRTGDAGRLDAQGRLWLLGRHGERIAGLHPFSVETAARFWPGVRRAALVGIEDRAILAIEGDETHRANWQREADAFGDLRVTPVAAIPLDKRHRSKVNYPALRRMLGR